MSLVNCVRIVAFTRSVCVLSCAAGILLCTAGCRDAGKLIGADPPPAQLGDSLKNLPTPPPPDDATLARQARLETVIALMNKRFTHEQLETISMAAHSAESGPGYHGNVSSFSVTVNKQTPAEIKQSEKRESERMAAARLHIEKQYHLTPEELHAIQREIVITD